MPIVSKVEAKSPRGRLIHLSIFVLLALGGVTMVYPFLVMLSGSVRSSADQSDLSIIPPYLISSTWVYRKFVETKYDQDVQQLVEAHNRQYFSFGQAQPPKQVNSTRIADLRAFMNRPDLPRYWQRLGGLRGYNNEVPPKLRELRSRLQTQFDDDLTAFSKNLGSPTTSWLNVTLPPVVWTSPRFDYQDNAEFKTYFKMMQQAPAGQRQLVALTGKFMTSIIYPAYGKTDTAAYNQEHTRDLKHFTDFHLPRAVPGKDQPKLRAEWLDFVYNALNPSFVTTAKHDPAAFRRFLKNRYQSIAELNKVWPHSYTGFDRIDLPGGWTRGQQRLDYQAYLKTAPPETLRLRGPEYAFRDVLATKYDTISQLNQAWNTRYADFSQILVPMAQLEYHYALNHLAALRWQFVTNNYINVFNELVFQGRPLFNTFVYVSIVMVLSLLINPLAAYAMSRFDLPGTYKVLLVLMAVTAFPPMVALIPQFILLRKLHLLNTFIALILPTIVHGYMIFLLKGFFDSLPQELYEAARIDGASEMRMFFQLTLSLSKPILAVLGLSVFTSAYTAFLYPLLVAPDKNMWLISVWIYQFQQRAPTSAVYASVVIASIPTLVIFLFAQRTIMRGIVVPTEK